MNWDEINVAYWYENVDKHKCGYCKNERGSISNGMTVQSLSVYDYQDLIDRGWRRSGMYCYKPIMDKTCCPQYTIKCKALELSLSKSQKKVIKKFNKFLGDGVLNKEDVPHEAQSGCGNGMSDVFIKETPHKIDVHKLKLMKFHHDEAQGDGRINEPPPVTPTNGIANKNCGDVLKNTVLPQKCTKQKENFKEGVGADLNKPPLKKAKLIRLERKKEKLLQRGMSLEKLDVTNQQKTLEQFLCEVPKNSKHQIKLKLISTSISGPDWQAVETLEYALYRKYQMIIHNDPPEKCTLRGFTRFLVTSPLKITLERMSEDHRSFELTAKLFAKYQMYVHNERESECDESVFVGFLVDSPLEPAEFPDSVEGCGFGSFHQQYWIDDKLIAVGVIDILPKCVSSVYFFYDPDYRSLTLGTYGSLREVEFARQLHGVVPGITYYYMGFYIHSCQKMRYKGKLVPSFLLCPETYGWFPIEDCIEKLEQSKYCRLNNDLDALDANACTGADINDIKILVGYNKITLFKYYGRDRDVFETVAQLIGRKCLRNFLIQLN